MTDSNRDQPKPPALDEWFGYAEVRDIDRRNFEVRHHRPIVNALCWVGTIAAFGALTLGEGYAVYQASPENSRQIVDNARHRLEQLPGKILSP
jgi:hypothetical protein